MKKLFPFLRMLFAAVSFAESPGEVLWIGMGTAEPNPFPASVDAFRAMMDKAGIHHIDFKSPGTALEWLTWRRSPHDFAPRLFR